MPLFNQHQAKVLDSVAKEFFVNPEAVNEIYIIDENKMSVATGMIVYYKLKDLKNITPAFRTNWKDVEFKGGQLEIIYNNVFKDKKIFYTTYGQKDQIKVSISFIYLDNQWKIYIIFPDVWFENSKPKISNP